MKSKALVNQFVAENLRTIRIAKGMKVQEVARRAGLAYSSYSCLEGGWYKINLDNLFRILLALDTDVSEVWPNGWISRLDDAAIEGLLDQARAQRPPAGSQFKKSLTRCARCMRSTSKHSLPGPESVSCPRPAWSLQFSSKRYPSFP